MRGIEEFKFIMKNGTMNEQTIIWLSEHENNIWVRSSRMASFIFVLRVSWALFRSCAFWMDNDEEKTMTRDWVKHKAIALWSSLRSCTLSVDKSVNIRIPLMISSVWLARIKFKQRNAVLERESLNKPKNKHQQILPLLFSKSEIVCYSSLPWVKVPPGYLIET